MNGKIDTVREALIKLRDFAKRLDCDYQEKCTPGEDDMCQSCKHVYIAELALAALSAIDLEAHGCDELVEKVITFFNNRVTIGEAEDECGDLVSVLELDKDFRSDLAKMLFAIDPEAIRPSEDTEKLCHQIYDVLSISPVLKLLDDGRLYALIAEHDEAIRRECTLLRDALDRMYTMVSESDFPIIPDKYYHHVLNAKAILSAEPAQVTCKTCRYSHHGVCEADQGEDCFQHGYKYYEPAQGDGKPEVGDVVAYCWNGEVKEITSYEESLASLPVHSICDCIVLMRAAEVKRRIEEAKE